jgi:hypothetical protein
MKAFLFALALIVCGSCFGGDLPKGKGKTKPVPSQSYQESLRKSAEKKKAATARKKIQRANAAYLAEEQRIAAQKEAERLAPIIAAQQAAQSQALYQQAVGTAALQMGQAAQKRAEIERRRYILESQEAGQAQIFDRSQGGFVPYSGSIGQPYPR